MFTHVYPPLGKWGNIWLIILWKTCHKYGFIPLPFFRANPPLFTAKTKGIQAFNNLYPLYFS